MKIPAKATIKGRASTITSQFSRAKSPYHKPSHNQLLLRYKSFGMDSNTASCVYCGGKQTEWDHLFAVVKNNKWTGYFTEINNLIPACGKCNQSRGNKPYGEWMVSDAVFSAKNIFIKRDGLSEIDALIEVKKRIKLIDTVVKNMPPKFLHVDNQSALETIYEEKRKEIVKLLYEAQEIAEELQIAYQEQTKI